MNSLRVGKRGLYVLIWARFYAVSAKSLIVFCLRVTTSMIGIISSRLASCYPLVRSWENTSAAGLLIWTRRIIAKSYPTWRSYHFTNLALVPTKLKIHLRACWSIIAIDLVPYKFGCIANVFQTTGRCYSWIVAKFRSQTIRILEQYPIALLTL